MPLQSRIVICLIASVYLIYAIYLLQKYRYLHRHGSVAVGELIGWSKVYRDWHWQPIVQFKTNKGRKIIIKPSYILYHLYPYLKQGQLLGILYDPNQPQNALVTSVFRVDWYALMGAILAFIVLIIGLTEPWILVILQYIFG